MALSKKLQDCVSFAKFAIEHVIEPNLLAELIRLSNRVVAAENRYASIVSTPKATKQRDKFRVFAHQFGFDVKWDSVVATLLKNGREYRLPRI